jgi:choline kinase
VIFYPILHDCICWHDPNGNKRIIYQDPKKEIGLPVMKCPWRGGRKMKGVILAAGVGTRLAPLTLKHPKPLLAIGGRLLLDYTIHAFVQAELRDLILVVGYMGEMIQRHVADGSRYGANVKYVFNPDYHLGNASSVHAVREVVGEEPFVLSMADHMISHQILNMLLTTEGEQNILCVDRQASAPPQVKDATKVWVNEKGLVTRIGKGLRHWNAIDTGVFRFSSAIFTAISQLTPAPRKGSGISDAVTWLIKRGYRIHTCDVSGAFWMDVDTTDDLHYVENIFAGARLVRGEL